MVPNLQVRKKSKQLILPSDGINSAMCKSNIVDKTSYPFRKIRSGSIQQINFSCSAPPTNSAKLTNRIAQGCHRALKGCSSMRGGTHLATTWLSCPNRSAAALTTSGETACGADERSGPGRYRPWWSRRSSAPASSSHGSLILGLGLGLRHSGSSPEAGGGDGCFRSPKSEERFVGGDRRFGLRKIEESFGAAAAVDEEERRRAAESAMGLGFFAASGAWGTERGRGICELPLHPRPSDRGIRGVDWTDTKDCVI
jgi:hypothetical protein